MSLIKTPLFGLFVLLAVVAFFVYNQGRNSTSNGQLQTVSLPPPAPDFPPRSSAGVESDKEEQPQPQQQQQHAPSGKCITYQERYDFCLNLHKSTNNDTVKLKRYFDDSYVVQTRRSMRRARLNPTADREVVLMRMHKKAWPLDFWLFVCSFLIEASANGKRDVFIYVIDGHESSIPAEFSQYVRVHPETELERIFKFLPYGGGYHRGDLAAGIFLKQNPQYTFLWMVECDVRYVGSWDQFFTDSRAEAKQARNYVPTAPNNGEGDRGKEAELIWYYPRMLNWGYDIKPENDYRYHRENWLKHFNAIWDYAQAPVPEHPETEIENVHFFSQRRHFRGKWHLIFNKTLWACAFSPAFGASRRLLILDYESALKGDSNENQEASMPLIAQLHGFKIVSLAGIPKFPLQFYFAFKKKTAEGLPESAPLYVTWMNGEPAARDQTEYNSYGLKAFEGKRCLANTVFHPVKF